MHKLIGLFSSFFIVACLSSSIAQTRPIVPRAAGEGAIGRPDKPWNSGAFLDSITLGNQTIGEWPDTSTTLVCLETNMNWGDTIKIPGAIYAIYDNAPYRKEDSILFGTTNISIVERENWIGTATTLTVATANTNAGVIAGSFSEKALPNGCWMYLENKEEPYWITSLDSFGTISWVSTSKNQLDAGTYNISMVSPVAQVENEGICYGTPDGTNQIFAKYNSTLPQGAYNGLSTIDGNIFFISSKGTRISKSIDGGGTWRDLNISAGKLSWGQILSIDNKTIWVVVENGNIWKGINGGDETQGGEWIKLSSLNNVYGITTADNTNIFAGTSSSIYISEDGGQSWTQISSTANHAWRQLKTIDGINIFAIENNGNFWKSDNGGYDWHNIGFVNNPSYSIETIDNTNIWVGTGGNPSKLFKSSDGGITWRTCAQSNAFWFLGITTIDSKHIYTTGYNTAIWYNIPNIETSSLTNHYTAIFNIESNSFQGFSELFDFAFNQTFFNMYFTFKTSEDEYSIFDIVNSEWTPIAKKIIDNQYAIRTTNMVLEVIDPNISSFSEAITKAMEIFPNNRKLETTYQNKLVYKKFTEIFQIPSNLTFSITFYSSDSKNYPLKSFDTDANFISDKYNIRYYDNTGYDIYVKELDDKGNVESSIYRKDASQANMRVFYFKNKDEE